MKFDLPLVLLAVTLNPWADVVAFAQTGLAAVHGQVDSAASAAGLDAELRRMTQELMDAIAPGNSDVWRRYLHEKMLHLDENGRLRDKQELLKELTPLPSGLVGRIEVDQFRVTQLGDAVVAAVEIQESLDYHGQTSARVSVLWIRGSRHLKAGASWRSTLPRS
jgi:hypothetical protein